jgi:hypothetical protein
MFCEIPACCKWNVSISRLTFMLQLYYGDRFLKNYEVLPIAKVSLTLIGASILTPALFFF